MARSKPPIAHVPRADTQHAGNPMACKIDHKAPDAIPSRICRACHPELNTTPEQMAEFIARDRRRMEVHSLKQELLRTRAKTATMSRDGEPDPCCVPVKARVYQSLLKKAARLEEQLSACQ